MSGITPQQAQIIQKCRSSVTWFLKNFGKLKHPSAGILPFVPFSYQRNAIKAFRQNRLNCFRKCRQCFSGESMVWGPNGPKRIDSINVGDLVYSYNYTTGLLEIVPVIEVFDNGELECVKVQSKTGHVSISTADHLYFTTSGEIAAGELTNEDILLEVNESERYEYDVSDSEAILLGYLLTDGYYGKTIHFTNTNLDYLLEFQEHLLNKFNIRGAIKPHSRDDKGRILSWRINIFNPTFREWLIELGIYGQTKDKKIIPQSVFKWSNKSISILLNRMFAGDGWYSGNHCNEAGICSESIITLNQIKQLLSRFDINSRVYPATNRGMPKLRIFGSTSFSTFYNKIDIFGKKPRLPITKGFFFNRHKGQVKTVCQVGTRRVYDINVPPHNNYIVDGVVVHNSGISKISGAFATWFGMFHNHKTILIVSRKNDDAMLFLRDNIVFLFEHLPKWMRDLWAPIKQNEHEIVFPNGSRIQSLTSHPDVLRSQASSLNIIDEAAFIQGMDVLWAGGWPCARFDTLVQTDDGLCQIGDLATGGDPWLDIDINVATDDGYKKSDKAFVSGRHKTTIINTYLGFEFEGTPHHRLRTIDQNGDYVWSELSKLSPDDLIISLPGQFVGKRRYVDNIELCPQFAEILGLYIGDGSLSTGDQKRLRIFFDPQDVSTRDLIIERFNNKFNLDTQAYDEFGGTTVNFRLNSAPFVNMLIKYGLNSKTCPQDATIPQLILQSDKDVLCAFLRGLFDSDGWCYQSSTCLKLGMSTTSKKLSEQVQVSLHALGILSRRILVTPESSKNEDRFSDEPYWRVDIWDANSILKFKEIIGFITHRKQAALDQFARSNEFAEIDHPALVFEFINALLAKMIPGTFRQCTDTRKWNLYRIRRIGKIRLNLVRELSEEFGLDDRLSKYVRQGFYFDKVVKLGSGETDTFDISVADNNTYLANGIISHNTLQHGGNVIVISTCVAPNTYIWTENGLCQIKDLAPNEYAGFEDGYYHANYDGPKVLGLNGLEMPSKFYKRPKENTKIIKTRAGFTTEVSTSHRILSVSDDGLHYIYSTDLKIGDYLPIERGRMIFGNNDVLNYRDNKSDKTIEVIDEELAYMLGIITAEGCLTSSSINVANGDSEIRNIFLNNKFGWRFTVRKNQPYSMNCNNSAEVYRFLDWFGFGRCKAPEKQIPFRLLSCSAKIIKSYLMGLFDGDGFSRARDGEVGLVSTSSCLLTQVRQVLNNFGIICKEEWRVCYDKEFNLNNRSYISHCLPHGRLLIRSGEARKFYERIGFKLERKQANYNNTKPSIEYIPHAVKLINEFRVESRASISDMNLYGIQNNILFGRKNRKNNKLSRDLLIFFLSRVPEDKRYCKSYQKIKILVESHYYYDDIVDIVDSESELMDFTIPDGHNFIGNCFIHHQTNGVGNWYWSTMTDAEAGMNQFNPIIVNWWDMDWVIEYVDPLSKNKRRIAPRDGIRKCTTKEDISKYGPYWSPWLEEQWRALQEQGESWKFEQEILANFIGSGNTVLDKNVISHIQTTVQDPEMRVTGFQTYVHPVTNNTEEIDFDFTEPDEGFWVWKKPVEGTPDKKKGDKIIEKGTKAHTYTMGVDIATGKGRDYSAIEVFDVDEMEQVAEFMARCLPRDLIKFIDRIGRWYNCALAVIERNNGGDTLIDSMRYDVMYPRIWRKKSINDTPRPPGGRRMRQRALKVKPYGFATSTASKPTLNKFLIDFVRDNEEDGYKIYSKRLLKQIQTYVRKRDRAGRDTNKTEAEDGAGNFDDLVIATGLALIGTGDATLSSESSLVPYGGGSNFKQSAGPVVMSGDQVAVAQKKFIEQGGTALLMPMTLGITELPETSAQRQLDDYTIQLGAIPIGRGGPIVTPSKFWYTKEK